MIDYDHSGMLLAQARSELPSTTSSPRCCAERRLLAMWEARARRHGVRRHNVATWIRRKAGSHLVVWRCLHDGLGCALPCLQCARQLAAYDFKIHCPLSADVWWHGRIADVGRPASKLTLSQRKAVERYKRHIPSEADPIPPQHTASKDAASVHAGQQRSARQRNPKP